MLKSNIESISHSNKKKKRQRERERESKRRKKISKKNKIKPRLYIHYIQNKQLAQKDT